MCRSLPSSNGESMDIPPKDTSLLKDSLPSQTHWRSSYLTRLGVHSFEDSDSTSVDSSDSSSSVDSFDSAPRDDFRNKFLHKLGHSSVCVPQARMSPKHQTVTIFDWDDTLLPTTWLREPCFEAHESDGYLLRRIAQHAKGLLEMAIKAGQTYIITNAMPGWVESSSARWAPELLPILQKVQIISARDKFEAAFPQDVGQWKIQTFLEVQRQLDATPVTNLVVLGDADYEMEAARIMGAEFSEGLVKTVKFLPNPNLEEHVQQLELVAQDLERIIGSVQNMQVNLEGSLVVRSSDGSRSVFPQQKLRPVWKRFLKGTAKAVVSTCKTLWLEQEVSSSALACDVSFCPPACRHLM